MAVVLVMLLPLKWAIDDWAEFRHSPTLEHIAAPEDMTGSLPLGPDGSVMISTPIQSGRTTGDVAQVSIPKSSSGPAVDWLSQPTSLKLDAAKGAQRGPIEKWLKRKKAAIFYISNKARLGAVPSSLTSLHTNFLAQHPYPVFNSTLKNIITIRLLCFATTVMR
jgi:hypothetical protein